MYTNNTHHMNYPKSIAHRVAQNLRRFRAASEKQITSEVNPKAQDEMREIVRQIDWDKYDEIIKQLEYCFEQDGTRIENATAKEKRQSF